MMAPDREEPAKDRLQREVAADGADSYHSYVKPALLPVLLVYVGFAALNSSHTVQLVSQAGGADSSPPDAHFRHVARDSGLAMELKSPLPTGLLRVHSWAAIAMFVLTFVQKERVGGLVAGGVGGGDTAAAAAGAGRRRALFWHRWIGRAVLVLMLVMDTAGYLMGPYSAWESFTLFEVLFFAPWPPMVLAVYFTASRHTVHLHRLAANVLVKACVATPLARLAGAALQRWRAPAGDAHNEYYYYLGIGSVTAAVTLWQVGDFYAFFKMQQLQQDILVHIDGATPACAAVPSVLSNLGVPHQRPTRTAHKQQ